MTHVIVYGAFVTRCVLRPNHATTWCLATHWLLGDVGGAEDCRACAREIAWAHNRMRSTRDLKRGAA